MSPRAAALPADERRAALVAAALPLLLEHGRGVTTRQVAEAAGVAEGTIFRVFDSKEDLVEHAVRSVLDQEGFLDELDRIDPGQGLRRVLLEVTARLQIRFRGIFTLMAALGGGPPRDSESREQGRLALEEKLVALISPYAGELRCRPDELALQLRLLTFGGSHPHFSGGRTLTPETIVSTLLDGLQRPGAAVPTPLEDHPTEALACS